MTWLALVPQGREGSVREVGRLTEESFRQRVCYWAPCVPVTGFCFKSLNPACRVQVLVEAPSVQNDTLDGEILGSFCPTSP